MSVAKKYITPDELRFDSFRLASKIVADGFRPQFMVALWRGGAPIGCFVHEFLKWKGIDTDHIAIRTSRYTGIDKAEGEVVVHSTSYLIDKLVPGSTVLLVDDVWDSGTTIVAFFKHLQASLPFDMSLLDIRVAVVYYKPTRNKTVLVPRYFVRESTEWLVFPHELEGMDLDEIERVMGKEISKLL